jgi:hypothetical protein
MVFGLVSFLESCAVFLSIAVRWLPVMVAAYDSFLSVLSLILLGNPRLLRMDYCLFLLASQEILPPPELVECHGNAQFG